MLINLIRLGIMDEAKKLSADKMTAEIGSLPPMKLHCGEMVEGALRSALEENPNKNLGTPKKDKSTLSKSLVQAGTVAGKIKVIPITDTEGQK